MANSNLRYRSEIDGLRAFAIIPVIFYHAGFDIAKGGFIGVDIFLAISGYLITLIILRDLDNECFSFKGFLLRRAKRLLPTLFWVIFLTIPIAYIWFPPIHMKDYSQSLVSTIMFMSNIHFAIEGGYFDTISNEKPFLHTWSLSLEEQFYLLYPPLLILCSRYRHQVMIVLVCSTAILSLLLSEACARYSSSLSYFMLPTRAWEFLSGGILALYVHRYGSNSSTPLSLIGFILICFSMLMFDKDTPHPSLWTVIPVFGTVLLLAFAKDETLIAKVLRYKWFVRIGLISYPLYLSHQPIFAAMRIIYLEPPTAGDLLLGSAVAVVFSTITYRLIEKPFRNIRSFSNKNITFSVSTTLIILIFGLSGHFLNGFITRSHMRDYISVQMSQVEKYFAKCDEEIINLPINFNMCFHENETVDAVLFGDSHAYDKFMGIENNINKVNWLLVGNTSCPPLQNIEIVLADNTDCLQPLTNVFNYLESLNGIKFVVLSFAHFYPLDEAFAADHIKRGQDFKKTNIKDIFDETNSKIQSFKTGLIRTISYFSEQDIPIILLYDQPELAVGPQDCIKQKRECDFLYLDYIERQQLHRDFIKSLAEKYENVHAFDPSELFCNASTGVCSVFKEGRSLYADSHHLSKFGGNEYGKLFAAWYDLNFDKSELQ